MRFRSERSVYVYGISTKPHFDRQVKWVGSFGKTATISGKDVIPVRNYGIQPRTLNYEYDPRSKWCNRMEKRVTRKLPKSAQCNAWDLMNYHAHTIQLALRRNLANKNIQ